jgi:hypothetical protein
MGRLQVKHHVMLMLVGPPFVLGLMYLFIALPGDPSFAKGITTHSRKGFAFLTLVLDYGTGFVLGIQLLNIRLFIDIHTKKEGCQHISWD